MSPSTDGSRIEDLGLVMPVSLDCLPAMPQCRHSHTCAHVPACRIHVHMCLHVFPTCVHMPQPHIYTCALLASHHRKQQSIML